MVGFVSRITFWKNDTGKYMLQDGLIIPYPNFDP